MTVLINIFVKQDYRRYMKRHEYWQMQYSKDRYLETASITEIEK